jgi:hypothetical protein
MRKEAFLVRWTSAGASTLSDVDPTPRSYLSQLVELTRGGFAALTPDQRRSQLDHFRGVVAGFEHLGLLTPDEALDWTDRMRQAIDLDPIAPIMRAARAEAEAATSASEDALVVPLVAVRDPSAPPPPAPRNEGPFIRSVAVGDLHVGLPAGGRLRVLGVYLFETEVWVHWMISPLPDVDAIYARELASVDPAARSFGPSRASHLFHRALREVELTDDRATSYVYVGGGSSGSGSSLTGEARFTPAVAAGATWLRFRFASAELSVALDAR